jgi:hypothetical protein
VERDFISMPANNKLPLQQVALVLTRTHTMPARLIWWTSRWNRLLSHANRVNRTEIRCKKFEVGHCRSGPYRTLALDASDEAARGAYRVRPVRLLDAGSQLAGGAHERLVARGSFAVGADKRVLQADAGV